MKIDPRIKADLKARLKQDLVALKKQFTVISAFKIGNEEISEIKKKFPALKDALIVYEVDKSLIAGYVIKIGSKVLDVSIRGKLQNFKKLIYGLD